MIPKQIIDQVIDAADIVSVVSNFLTLKRAGANFKAICPFHDDKDASLVVSPAKKIWKCFGCGAGGNAISFMQKHEALSFPEAIRTVAKDYNIDVPTRELSDQERAEIQRRDSLFIAMEAAQDIYTQNLKNKEHAEAISFLRSRKFKAETIERFAIGFAPFQFQHLTKIMPARGYSMQTIIDAGLVSQKNNKTFDRLIQRITFPFYNNTGQIIGFTGRKTNNNDDKSPKWLNFADTALFDKSAILFGLHQAKRYIQNEGKAYLTEGQFDVMRKHEAGFYNTVCGSGTALTQQQARLLKRFATTVTIIYDGDDAGARAAIRNAQILLAEGLNVRAAILPAGEDPDSFILKMGADKYKTWLKNNETGFIRFATQLHKQQLDDPAQRTEVIELLAETIASIPSDITRENMIIDLGATFQLSEKLMRGQVSKHKKPEALKTEKQKPGVHGLEEARKLIANAPHDEQEINITGSVSIFAEDWETKPTVLTVGKISINDIQTLRGITPSVSCRDNIKIGADMVEPDILATLAKLHQSGFSVVFKSIIRNTGDDKDQPDEYRTLSFTEHYIDIYSDFANDTEYNHSQAVERCAKVISQADETTRTIRLGVYAGKLGLTKSGLEKILEKHLGKRRSEMQFRTEFKDDAEGMQFDGTEIPTYVESDQEMKRIYNTHGFFPLLDGKDRPVSYVFKTKSGHIRVGNFYIDPLLHIYDKETEYNKRVVKVTQRRRPHPFYMEWISREMITMQTFRQRLWEEGDINFSNGSQAYLDKINESWEGKFMRCTELRMYGYYDDGFFAFSNAIYHKTDAGYQIQYVTDLGLVTHNSLNYYIPVFSKIYRDERRDNDRYFLDRFVAFKEPEVITTFEEWAKLFAEVYKENNNGWWGIIYAFMAAYRSEIFSVDRIFTALFFIGPTGSGKSEIAYSIRSLFVPPEAPIFNLNQGTDAAMFTLMEKYRDIPIILDEYNDIQISDVKFQGLKAAVYDGEGKQKRKDAATKDLDTSEINSPLIICGQESPQRDDNSLANRSIIRDVPKKDDRTEHEDNIFRELKEMEKAGLQNILLQMLEIRDTVKGNYRRVQREVYRELKGAVRENVVNSDGLSRIQNTYSMFLAMARIIEDQTNFKLPFTYEEFEEVVILELLKQVESISSSNRLYAFFSAIDALIDAGSIIEGREFKIETPGTLRLQKQGRKTYEHDVGIETRVIHLRIDNIYPHYHRLAGGREALSAQSLRSYLQSHESYIGASRSSRFKWEETDDMITGVADATARRTRVSKEKVSSSIVLNYDILTELLNIDYERNVEAVADIATAEKELMTSNNYNNDTPF